MTNERTTPNPPLWLAMLATAMAGGMGWGIRGQYGHETGAMIAGVLVSLVLVFLFCPGNRSIHVVRAAALGTIAMGFGGSMTYGQTIGLTHDGPLVGNWEALRWGMLGLAIKGSVWIGFAGLFLGIGLGGKRYRPSEMFLLVLGMLMAVVAGWWLFNSPHDPENKRLPFFYFSDHWHWEPDVDLKHRPEIWGGLLTALVSGMLYATFAKGDRLARNLALWGMLGGALGFPIGQTLQATNAWNPEFFRESFVGGFTQYFNWWNIMETTFGAVMGAVLGLGLWLNRRRIAISSEPDVSPLPGWLVGLLLAMHVTLIGLVEFSKIDWIDGVYDLGVMMGLIPLLLCVQGRWGPYLQLLPITLLPIAGKTLRALVDPAAYSVTWLAYLFLPMMIATTIAVWFARQAKPSGEHPYFIRCALLFCVWVYHDLNFAFFSFPWPWEGWGGRHPNATIFFVCMLGLSAVALFYNPTDRRWQCKAWQCDRD
ncbi:MAG: hypothetical protein VX392_00685 [Verrucomicrobiota bacterium]|nr:hypothetical protein [Verrucomicrobiota bacterium]